MSTLSQFVGGSSVPVGGFTSAVGATETGFVKAGGGMYVATGLSVKLNSAEDIADSISRASGAMLPDVNRTQSFGAALTSQYQQFLHAGGVYLRATESSILRSTDGVSWAAATLDPLVRSQVNNKMSINGQIVHNGTSFYVLLGINSDFVVMTSADGLSWTTAFVFPVDSAKNSATFSLANNVFFVCLGHQGTPPVIWRSTNGTDWSAAMLGAGSSSVGWQPTQVAFGAGAYVVGNRSSNIGVQGFRSTDGINWTPTTVGQGTSVNNVKFLNSQFVAVGGAGGPAHIHTSPTGVTWTSRTANQTTILKDVIFANAMYVVYGESGAVSTSTDGATWTARTYGNGNTIHQIIFAAGRFVSVHGGSNIITSTDGVTWTAATTVPYTSVINANIVTRAFNTHLIHDGSAYFSSDGFGGIMRSTDGATWTRVLRLTGSTGFLAPQLAMSTTKIVLATNGAIFTGDLATQSWQVTLNNGVAYSKAMFANGLFVVGGVGGSLQTSPDGITWTSRSAGAGAFSALAHGNGTYVAFVSGTTNLYTSPDGVTWTLRAAAIPVATGNTTATFASGFFAACTANSVSTSADGITWTSTFNLNVSCRLKVAGDVHFLMPTVGGTGDVYVIPSTALVKSLGVVAPNATSYDVTYIKSTDTYLYLSADSTATADAVKVIVSKANFIGNAMTRPRVSALETFTAHTYGPYSITGGFTNTAHSLTVIPGSSTLLAFCENSGVHASYVGGPMVFTGISMTANLGLLQPLNMADNQTLSNPLLWAPDMSLFVFDSNATLVRLQLGVVSSFFPQISSIGGVQSSLPTLRRIA